MTTEGTGLPRRRGRPAGRRAEDTRAAVLAAARARFASAGYERTSLAEIAEAAGLTPRALYHYADSKPELFAQVTKSVLGRLGDEVLQSVLPQPDTRSRLRALVDVFRTLHTEDPTLVAFVGVLILEAGGNPEVAAALGDEDGGVPVALVRGVVDLGLAQGDIARDVDRDGAVALIESVGAGITLLAGAGTDTFEATLGVLDRLIDGSLFTAPPP